MLKIFSFLLIIISLTGRANNPVEKHGRLRVKGNFIIDQNDSIVQLKGMSLFWSQWIGKYYNAETVKWLRDDWNCEVIRAAMGVERGGYLTDPMAEKQKIINVVNAAVDLGIYVIIDWHDHHAEAHVQESQLFFAEMARTYAGYPNIIYEIYNEPLKISSWSKSIKPYHEAVIGSIRKYDPLNLIVCGTRSWSQDVDEASLDPVSDKNVAYSLHYYAGTHKQWLRDKAQRALDNGVAIFVTEYGTCNSNGNGAVDYEESLAWWKFLDKNHISYCNWSVADKDETSSIFLPGTGSTGNFDTASLSQSGLFVRGWMKGYSLSDLLSTSLFDNNKTPFTKISMRSADRKNQLMDAEQMLINKNQFSHVGF